MNRYTKRLLAIFLTIALFVGMIPAHATEDVLTGNDGLISTEGGIGVFPLVANGLTATIWIDAKESVPVKRVVGDFKDDVKRVTNQDASVSSDPARPEGPVVIVGTLDGSDQIKELIATGKITTDEVNAIQGKWEAYLIKVVDENTLVVAGSDPRGAIFGVYEISEQMGVSPWYFFADAEIKAKSAVYITAGTSITDMPDVQYRGVFLNDEEKLSRWATEVFKDPNVMGPKTYAKIFELILRLKGNYIWAAMHVNSINNVPGNIDLVQEYGIVLGSSHCDILLRTNVHEWKAWTAAKAPGASYDYTVSKNAVLQYWRENVERHKDTEAQWTLGMRGAHDEPFDAHNLMNDTYKYLLYGEDNVAGTQDDIPDSLENRKALLMNEIIAEQQKILKEVLEEKYDEAFQALIPYKEVLPIYNNPYFDLPDEVTVIWCDDNHSIMRRMPDATERAREGGHGIYYHVSYWAPADQSYMWLSSAPLSLIGEELNKSWENNIQKAWILNIGDIKPLEAEMTFFIRYGWDVEQYKNNSEQFIKDWTGAHFGSQYSNEVADILNAFYQHTNVRKLDHMRVGLFNQTHYGDESSKRMAVYQDLFDRTQAIYDALPEGQKLGFYELVQCKINWAYYVNKAYYYADRSNLAYDQGRLASADAFLKLSQEADQAKKSEIARYGTIADGKWKGFIDPENAAPPVISQLPPGTPALVLGEAAMGVVVQGEKMPQENSNLTFSPYNQDGKFIDVFNKGSGSFNWTVTANQSWVKFTKTAGTVNDETRLWVTIEDIEAHKGEVADITITDTDKNTAKKIQVTIENPAKALSEISGYAEADGYVSIEAEHYSRLNSKSEKTWQTINDLGRAFGGDVMRAYDPALGTIDEAQITMTAPSLEYDINLTSSGVFPLEIYRIPTLNSKGQVRFAVSVDDGAPIVVESAAADEGQGTIWVSNLFHMIEKHVVKLPNLTAGEHIIKLWMVDNFIMVDKMVLYTGAEGIIPTELGPDESYHSEFYTTFTSSIPTLDRTSVLAEPKDIPATWGSGAFVEQGGRVALEAEYAMENVLASVDEVTSDMNAYTVSKRDKASEVANKIPNTWRITQSDTGMAMRLPDLGGQWTDGKQFVPYSPELTYKINFTTTGTYNVWLRWRFVDDASDSVRGGLDNKYADSSFSGSAFFSNNLDEKWHWAKVGAVNATTQGYHPFSLWMREDGLYIDRIYLTTGSETPSDSSTWLPSVREENLIAQLLRRAVNTKRAEMTTTSYPLGDGAGCYSKETYDALLTTLDRAEKLSKNSQVTQEQADAAIKAIDDADKVLGLSLNLTENGITYNAFRNFSDDTVGKLPYGFTVENLTNGAAATVQEENGDKFLRLTTSSTAGKANLILPYVGTVKSDADHRVVVEYRARFIGTYQYANNALVINDSGANNFSMATAFENANQVHEIRVHRANGGTTDKVNVSNFVYGQWHTFKMVANWDNKTYTVYMDNNPFPVATNFNFRNSGGTRMVSQRFGIDGYANGTLDFDDFRVSIVDATSVSVINGNVSITGTAQRGQELTADVSSIVESAYDTLRYAWIREDGIFVGTESTYTPTQSDVGKTLTLTVTGTGAYVGSITSGSTDAVADADNTLGDGLKIWVDDQRAELAKLSIPVGDDLGSYSYSAYAALVGALNGAESLSQLAPDQTQVEAAKTAVTNARAALTGDKLNLVGDGITYNVYRDFESDQVGKLPYGFTDTLASGGTAQIIEENGNRFLRLTTSGTTGSKAEMVLPYIGTVNATADQRIVIEYRARFNNESCSYSNGVMVRNSSGNDKYSMVVAFENDKKVQEIRVHKGTASSDKAKVANFVYSQWYTFKLVGNWDAKTYSVYMDGEKVAEDFSFRDSGGTVLVGQRIGLDKLNGQVDYDDFKVSVVSPSASNDITSVATVASKSVPYGTVKENIGLPKKVEITLSDGSKAEAAVTWESATYTADTLGTYDFTGTLAQPEGVTNTKNLTAAAKVAVSKIRVAAVGDSITFGSASAGPINDADKYPAKLQALLGENYEVKNFGVSGACMLNKGTDSGNAKKGYIEQAEYAASKNFLPDVVVIMLGTNDSKALNWDKYKAEYVDDALALIQSYRNLSSKPTVYIATSPTVIPGINNYGIQGDVVHNEIIPLQKQTALIADCGFIDVHEATKDATLAQFPDYVHGNAAGYTLISNAVYTCIVATELPKAAAITHVDQVTGEVPAGQLPKLPIYAPVAYQDGKTGVAAVTWNLIGLSFDTAGGIVIVPGTLKGLDVPASAQVTVTNAQVARLQTAADTKRAELETLSYPLGTGVGRYSQAAYNALIQVLNDAEELAKDADVTEVQATAALNEIATADMNLANSLNLVDGDITYNAYRDFSDDEVGKLPYGFNVENLSADATATVHTEGGDNFLRLTTVTKGKANLFLPYMGEVTADANQEIVIEFKVRFVGKYQYANAAMLKHDNALATDPYAMVVAFDNGSKLTDNSIKVQSGSSKPAVMKFEENTWYQIKMVANWHAQTYSVYINDTLKAESFNFRNNEGSKLLGQRFGIDNYANGTLDLDDFKVSITAKTGKEDQAAPTGLGKTDETAENTNDGTITGVDTSMEWSTASGASWTNVVGSAIENLAAGKYWVRYCKTNTHKASPHVELTILGYNQPANVSGVTLDRINVNLYTNRGTQTVQLIATVEPAEAVNKTVTWISSNEAVATVDETGLVTVHAAGTAVITVTTEDGNYTASCTVTVSAYVDNESSDESYATTIIVKNEDGSTTRTVTDKSTGTVTETTTWPNGERVVVKKEKNGTLTETVTKQDGSKSETVTKSDGSSKAVVTDAKGIKVEIITTSSGDTSAAVSLPKGIAKARIIIPVEGAKASTVAVIIKEDGTKEIMKTSIMTEDGMCFIAQGDVTVKLVDNKATFSDVANNHWASEAIAFTTSRELFVGAGQGTFSPNVSMSRAMLFTVLTRLDGAETDGGKNWYSKAMDWAVDAGISDGSAPQDTITREQLATMLYRYAGQPTADGESKTFADSGKVSTWASEAMDWAVKMGVLTGKTGDHLDPAGFASRAEVSTILMRFIALRNQV